MSLDMDGPVTENEEGDRLERKNVKLIPRVTVKKGCLRGQ